MWGVSLRRVSRFLAKIGDGVNDGILLEFVKVYYFAFLQLLGTKR